MTDTAEAAAVIAADQERRARLVGEAIAAILKEHNCDLVAVPFIQDGRINAQVQVVAK